MNIPVSVLIPVLNPGEDFIPFTRELASSGFQRVLIIDDGSKPECQWIFETIRKFENVTVISHAVNLGKGRALKTGLNYFLQHKGDQAGIVTADADGQHTIPDIKAVAKTLVDSPTSFILGARTFKTGVPLRSLVGNQITRYVYAALVGQKISDTQSGLRGLPTRHVGSFLKTTGEAYEYEMNSLIQCRVLGIPVREVPIETIYIEGNRSSHFNPLLDSMKIYFLLLRFAFSSLSSSFVDFLIFTLVFKVFDGSILTALIAARAVASIFNFVVNRQFVFHAKGERIRVLAKYYALVVVLMSFSYLMISKMVAMFSFPVLICKVIVESLLFVVSFTIQRDFIFSPSAAEETADEAPGKNEAPAR